MTASSHTPAKNLENELDDAVADSFPASDPVSLAQPHDNRELRREGSGPSPYLVGGVLLLLALFALR